MNRLNLNWSLEWNDERADFIRRYCEVMPFEPTAEELDTMSKYILWGKDRKTSLNGRQAGLELETRYGVWDHKKTESLDALLESPAFNETAILPKGMPPTKVVREVFSRKEARELATPEILVALENLWRLIDETELLIGFYDLSTHKRSTPIREALLRRFTSDELTYFQEKASHLSNLQYLRQRHNLVELRRQQYTLKDSYSTTLLDQPTTAYFDYKPIQSLSLGEEVQVLPFGLWSDRPLDQKIFNSSRLPNPYDFSEAELQIISTRIWTKNQNPLIFDFCNPDHLYALFEVWEELEEQELTISLDPLAFDFTLIHEFMETARIYKSLAHLEPIHTEILEMKVKKKTNQEIMEYVNEKYGKKYKVNYISTLYCKKCLGSIAAAASEHYEVIQNLFFEENFKKCKDCGGIYLLDEKNFVKRRRSADGYSPRCKRCEKNLREKKKNE